MVLKVTKQRRGWKINSASLIHWNGEPWVSTYLSFTQIVWWRRLWSYVPITHKGDSQPPSYSFPRMNRVTRKPTTTKLLSHTNKWVIFRLKLVVTWWFNAPNFCYKTEKKNFMATWGCAFRHIFGVSGDYTICWRKRQRENKEKKREG